MGLDLLIRNATVVDGSGAPCSSMGTRIWMRKLPGIPAVAVLAGAGSPVSFEL
jgi:hypothetical protein